MKVAIVHDDLMQWGGAERVLLGILEIYPQATIYTSVYNSSNQFLIKHFAGKKIITSFLQKIPNWKKLYKALLPLYGIAFEQFNFDEYDLVISSTTRFAKAIITKPKTIHICYCHTPPRFLWNLSGNNQNKLLNPLLNRLRDYDLITSKRPDYYLAGSKNAQDRIKKIYDLKSMVVCPFIDLDRFEKVETFDGGYLLSVGRPNYYKRFDLVEDAGKRLNYPVKIIKGDLDEEMVMRMMAGCKALVMPGIEDFGLTSLEAQALGKPVIAFSSGGALETVMNNQTGVFFDTQSVESLCQAICKLDSLNLDTNACKENAKKFSKENFIKNFKQTVDSLV